MRTVVLICSNRGAVEVSVKDVHPYVRSGDGTATYSFDCALCEITHHGLHASIGIANTLKHSGVSTERLDVAPFSEDEISELWLDIEDADPDDFAE